MRKEFQGTERLSIVLGIVGAIVGLLIAISVLSGGQRDVTPARVFVLAVFIAPGFFLGWGAPRLIYWVYMGFKKDKDASP